MSQIIRPTTASPSREGMIRNVAGSGIATMSDSSIALKPVIDEPSKPIPSSSAASISCGVIAKLFRCPSRSVNQKRTYSTFCFSISFSTCLRDSGSDVARCLLSIIAIASLLRTWKCEGPRVHAVTGRAPEAPSPQRLEESIRLAVQGHPRCEERPRRRGVRPVGVRDPRAVPVRDERVDAEDDVRARLEVGPARVAEAGAAVVAGRLRGELQELRREPVLVADDRRSARASGSRRGSGPCRPETGSAPGRRSRRR